MSTNSFNPISKENFVDFLGAFFRWQIVPTVQNVNWKWICANSLDCGPMMWHVLGAEAMCTLYEIIKKNSKLCCLMLIGLAQNKPWLRSHLLLKLSDVIWAAASLHRSCVLSNRPTSKCLHSSLRKLLPWQVLSPNVDYSYPQPLSRQWHIMQMWDTHPTAHRYPKLHVHAKKVELWRGFLDRRRDRRAFYIIWPLSSCSNTAALPNTAKFGN